MKYLGFVFIVLVTCFNVKAEIKLPAMMGSDMVLQRNTTANLWGKAKAGKKVLAKTSWNGKSYSATVDANGNWKIGVQTPAAGGPYTITFSGDGQVVLDNILIGEVWISSGQSNMEMPMTGFMGQPVEGSIDEILDASKYPGIRMFTVARNSTDQVQDDCKGSWKRPDAETVGQFSAVAYLYAKQLNKSLGIPIGIVTTNWGGSTIEAWMPSTTINEISGINQKVAFSGTYEHTKPEVLYNGMIAPLRNYTAKGFIWYQGESNIHNYFDYAKLMAAMVNQWRKDWQNPEMFFYYAQLAPYSYQDRKAISLPLQIEAQYAAFKLIPKSGIAATNDVGHATCIHPAKKREVGQRLAFLALDEVYGLKGYPVAPTIKNVVYNKSKALLSFNGVPKENQFNDINSFDYYTGVLLGFEVAGADKKFYPAKARHLWWKSQIELECPEVQEPVAVRYGFRNFSDANVKTTMGMPLVPFRTDRWDTSF